MALRPALLHLLVPLALLLAVSGCAASKPAAPTSPAAATVERALRAEVHHWEGTPHQMGGMQRSGADCSGFVMAVYRDVFGLQLPRVTEEQVEAGQAVRRRNLRAGDLVFFRNPDKTRHVGIYLSEEEFAHVSSSQGVMISRLDQAYWRRAYWTSRRVLSEAAVAASPRPVPPRSTSPPRTGDVRVGW